jgi:HNH endonuclease
MTKRKEGSRHGQIRTRNGYRLAVGDSDKYEHVVVAEAVLGRLLPGGAIVHHVNGVKTDNRPENLVICPDQGYHKLIHARQRIVDAGGNPNADKVCSDCKQVLPRAAFCLYKGGWDGLFNNCRECTSKRKLQAQYKRSPESVTRSNAARRNDPVRWARHLEWTRDRARAKRAAIAAAA